MDTLRKKETLLYVILWAIVFEILALSLRDLKAAALQLLPFLVLFLAHNYSLTPLLFRKQRGLYMVLTAVLFGVFVFYCLRSGLRPPVSDPMPPFAPGPGGPPKRILPPEVVRILVGFWSFSLIWGSNLTSRPCAAGRRLPPCRPAAGS